MNTVKRVRELVPGDRLRASSPGHFPDDVYEVTQAQPAGDGLILVDLFGTEHQEFAGFVMRGDREIELRHNATDSEVAE